MESAQAVSEVEAAIANLEAALQAGQAEAVKVCALAVLQFVGSGGVLGDEALAEFVQRLSLCEDVCARWAHFLDVRIREEGHTLRFTTHT